jgi:L,D-transpeptidase ErfK/SrfK
VASGAQLGSKVVGEIEQYSPSSTDNIWTLSQKVKVSALRLLAANPGVSEDLGTVVSIIVPRKHIVPVAKSRIVVDVDRRLLFLREPNSRSLWSVYDASVGADDRQTPLGEFRVVRKSQYPAWYPTERQRAIDGHISAIVKPGRGNPLGSAALYLNKYTYLIHGTSDDWQVGLSETDGCIELRNSVANYLYLITNRSERIGIEKSNDLIAVVHGDLYLEAGPYFSKNTVNRLPKEEARRRADRLTLYMRSESVLRQLSAISIEFNKATLEDAFELGVGYPVIVGYVNHLRVN